MSARLYILAFAVCSLASPLGCGDSATNSNSNDAANGAQDGATTVDGAIQRIVDGGEVNGNGQALCEDKDGLVAVCECDDSQDNDEDTFVDAVDPECSGPFDNDESSYATGIPGDNQSRFAQDCFFDGDSGGGNDGCRWDTRCEDVVPPYEGTHCNNQQLDGCGPCRGITPNGCDCFGCCIITIDGQAHSPVRIIEGCTADTIDDATKCPPCQQVSECVNECEDCEYCLGQTPDESCEEDDVCPEGVSPCDAVDSSCPTGESCITGCCRRIIQ